MKGATFHEKFKNQEMEAGKEDQTSRVWSKQEKGFSISIFRVLFSVLSFSVFPFIFIPECQTMSRRHTREVRERREKRKKKTCRRRQRRKLLAPN